MKAFNGIGEASQNPEFKENSGKITFSQEIQDKYDKLFGDDKMENTEGSEEDSAQELTPEEREEKLNKLFAAGDFFDEPEESSTDGNIAEGDTGEQMESGMSGDTDGSEQKDTNSSDELDGDVYETDDNGETYKRNGELLPNIEYTVNGNTYRTDENGRIISCVSKPTYTEDGMRNTKEQQEAGGEDRQEGDDGGHLIARILGGGEGLENLVAMRDTLNRGDYKKMENEIANALQEGKDVEVDITLRYDGDSQRPSRIQVEYTIDGKKTIVVFDNEKDSTELLDSLDGKISDEDYDNLKEELEDMKEDGGASITSIKTEYDEDGNPTKVTVGVLDESTGRKTYKTYEPK